MGAVISDLHHVSINVDDLDAAEHFYIEVLGLERLDRPQLHVDGTWLAAGGRQVHLIVGCDVPPDVGQHFAFRVDDLDGAIAHLADHQIVVSRVLETPVSRQVSLNDPCGNRIELNEPKATG